MIKEIKFFVFIFLLNSFQILGQESETSLPKWHVNFGVNANFLISDLKKEIPTDYLFDYGHQRIYPQFLFTGTYFLNANWGITAKANIGIPSIKKSRNSDFENSLISFYQNDFFVTSFTGAKFDKYQNADGGYIGITYRKRKGKIVYLPQLVMGMTSIRVDKGNVFLKEKGSNTIFHITYSHADETIKEYFTITPAFSVGYNFSKKWMFNFDLQYGVFFLNTDIEEQKRNTFTEEIASQTISYKKNMHFINLGCSFTRTF